MIKKGERKCSFLMESDQTVCVLLLFSPMQANSKAKDFCTLCTLISRTKLICEERTRGIVFPGNADLSARELFVDTSKFDISSFPFLDKNSNK